MHQTEWMLKAVGERTRLRILALLRHGPLCVCQLVDILGLSQPTVSKHLSILGAAGLVEDEKRGKWVFYRLPAAPSLAARGLLRWLFSVSEEIDAVRRDRCALRRKRPDGLKASCPPRPRFARTSL